jgi:hypothetical protein
MRAGCIGKIQIHSQICKDVLHAKQIEQELIEKQQFKLNANKAYSGINLPGCHSEYNVKYYEANRDRLLKKQTVYREANRDKEIERSTKYYEENRDKISNYLKANRDNILEKQAKYREKNRDVLNAKQRDKRALNKTTKTKQEEKTETEAI